jgi:hypothetical protein
VQSLYGLFFSIPDIRVRNAVQRVRVSRGGGGYLFFIFTIVTVFYFFFSILFFQFVHIGAHLGTGSPTAYNNNNNNVTILTQPMFALGLAHALPVQQLVPRNTLKLRAGKAQMKFASEKKSKKKKKNVSQRKRTKYNVERDMFELKCTHVYAANGIRTFIGRRMHVCM